MHHHKHFDPKYIRNSMFFLQLIFLQISGTLIAVAKNSVTEINY
jgi:hypothetical protein